jgi:trans-2,3-dihydro-3-hydroxyanthranilate isomerase
VPHPLYTVDVFAERSYAGNPLAIVLDAADLSTESMQSIAREMDYSETTFVLSREAGADGFPVRIFTPSEELPFAGHPTLGTAWLLRRTGIATAARVTLALGVGSVPVTFEGEEGYLQAPDVEVGPVAAGDEIAARLGLDRSDLHETLPVCAVSAGMRIWIVPLAGRDALARSRPSQAGLAAFASDDAMPAVYCFCHEPHLPSSDLAARMYFDSNGLREDPATGSATAFLGAYLLEHAGRDAFSLRVDQGHEMGRPSLLKLRGERVGGARRVQVGGRVIPVVEGTLR